jgi:beta-lactamase regulating signal transducer with metallopeptidase domain
VNANSLFAGSLHFLAVLSLEVALISLAVSLLARWTRAPSWRRTFWQTGVVAVFALTACELSGSGRVLARWALDTLAWAREDQAASEAHAQPPAPVPQLNNEFRSRVEARLAAHRVEKPQPGAITSQPARSASIARDDLNLPARPALPAARAAPQATESGSDFLHTLWLWLAWGIGTVLLLGRACVGRCFLFLLRLRRRQVTDPVLLSQVRSLSRELGMRGRVRLIESDRLRSPIAFGLLFPTVGLPRGFSLQFTPARQEAMLAHELAHLAARDPAWSLMADLSAALLWWHPAAWWARRQFYLASELAADEASLLLEDGPTTLAECLVELGARMAGGRRVLGELQVSGFRSHLGRRVQRLVHLEGRAWSPPARWRGAMMVVFGPLVMAALVILCTAWATPGVSRKGNSMQSMQLTLRRSLATLALLAAISDPDAAMSATAAATSSHPAAANTADNTPSANSAAQNEATMAAFRRRYGIPPPGPSLPAANTKRQKIETKLNEILLPEIQFGGVPLSEVIRMLSDQAVKLDPENKGINFLINCQTAPAAVPTPIDPTTGLLSATSPSETIDVNSIMVKFSLPLRNVSLKDTLEAVVRVAERPLEYSVEDYGVVVSAKVDPAIGQPLALRQASVPEALFAATFKVDTNTFLAGLENAFGITMPHAGPGQSKAQAREIQAALKSLLTQLGVGGGDNKTVFYNDLTGIIMIRATENEQGVIQAAMETLGGTPVGSYGSRGGGGGSWGMTTPAVGR